MKFSILINNYNYGRFLCDSVESCLAQTYPAHEIIVVDDGSTDDSLQILKDNFGANPRVKVIANINRGQTAAVATGIEASTGNILCLMDSDDRYKPEYLATLKEHYTEFPTTDMTFCRYDSFGKDVTPDKKGTLEDDQGVWLNPRKDYDFGYTALLAYFGNTYWLGNITSNISLRARLGRTLDLHEVARLFYVHGQADFSVLLGGSLLGGRKFYLHRILTEHRVHDSNDFAMLHSTVANKYKHDFVDIVRFEYFKRRSGISEAMFYRLAHEMETIPDPDPKHVEVYRKIMSSGEPLQRITQKLRNVVKRG